MLKQQLKYLKLKLSQNSEFLEILNEQIDTALEETCEEFTHPKASGADSLEGIFRGPALNKKIFLSSYQEQSNEVET